MRHLRGCHSGHFTEAASSYADHAGQLEKEQMYRVQKLCSCWPQASSFVPKPQPHWLASLCPCTPSRTQAQQRDSEQVPTGWVPLGMMQPLLLLLLLWGSSLQGLPPQCSLLPLSWSQASCQPLPLATTFILCLLTSSSHKIELFLNSLLDQYNAYTKKLLIV